MNTQHSPKFWKISWEQNGAFIYADSDPRKNEPAIAHVYKSPRGEANARLIAAAPELLRIAQDLLKMVDEMLPKAGPCGWGTLATDDAREVIAAATTKE